LAPYIGYQKGRKNTGEENALIHFSGFGFNR
jgi:hypothetical protein